MTLPIAVSVPHAGLHVPQEAAAFCQLTEAQIVRDGDEGAAEIFTFKDAVAEFVTTDVARAIVDLNRADDDRRADGVVKSHTIWGEAIYRQPLPAKTIKALLEAHYYPIHRRLANLAKPEILFCIDCHTMAACAPPICSTPGEPRPEICLGNVHGKSIAPEWTSVIHQAFVDRFRGYRVTLNDPFAGGFITQNHGQTFPWIQLEVSRANFMPKAEIRTRILDALRMSVDRIQA